MYRGPVVQPGRTPPLRGGSRRFKSGPAHHARAKKIWVDIIYSIFIIRES